MNLSTRLLAIVILATLWLPASGFAQVSEARSTITEALAAADDMALWRVDGWLQRALAGDDPKPQLAERLARFHSPAQPDGVSGLVLSDILADFADRQVSGNHGFVNPRPARSALVAMELAFMLDPIDPAWPERYASVEGRAGRSLRAGRDDLRYLLRERFGPVSSWYRYQESQGNEAAMGAADVLVQNGLLSDLSAIFNDARLLSEHTDMCAPDLYEAITQSWYEVIAQREAYLDLYPETADRALLDTFYAIALWYTGAELEAIETVVETLESDPPYARWSVSLFELLGEWSRCIGEPTPRIGSRVGQDAVMPTGGSVTWWASTLPDERLLVSRRSVMPLIAMFDRRGYEGYSRDVVEFLDPDATSCGSGYTRRRGWHVDHEGLSCTERLELFWAEQGTRWEPPQSKCLKEGKCMAIRSVGPGARALSARGCDAEAGLLYEWYAESADTSHYPQDREELLVLAAFSYLSAGDTDSAGRVLRAFLVEVPESEWADWARSELEALEAADVVEDRETEGGE